MSTVVLSAAQISMLLIEPVDHKRLNSRIITSVVNHRRLCTKSNMAVNSDNRFIREKGCFIDTYTQKQ